MDNSNTNENTISAVEGRPARGRVLFIGSMANATIAITPLEELPNYYVPKNPSWIDLNRGKLSKRQRRI